MPIYSLRLKEVGPFDDIEFEFDEHVNVLVGPNNCGKTCALTALGSLLTYAFDVPRRLLRGPAAESTLTYGERGSERRSLDVRLPLGPLPTGVDPEAYRTMLGSLGFCKFVPAVRRSTDFRSPGPTAEGEHQSEGLPLWASFWARKPPRQGAVILGELPQVDALLVRDETVVQAMVDLDYRSYREEKPWIRGLLDSIARIASAIAEGFPIRFLGVGEDRGGLSPRFGTPDGELPLNCLSQGTQSIIQWVAHLLLGYGEYYDFPKDLEQQPAAFIIDEIDAHLHPSWARRIIPTLTQHFPKLQLFCSTHSPLMLAGLKAGQVHLLKRDEKGKVVVSRNQQDIAGWSADEILRCFLDVPEPTDLETAKHVERLQELRAKESLTAEEKRELEQLRHTVSEEMLGGPPIAGELARLKDLLVREDEGPGYATKAKRGRATKQRHKAGPK